MKCALWLNKTKIFSADEIPENFDAAALRGYFFAGSLVPWLRENGGERYADKLEGLSQTAPDLNERLLDIFGKPEQAAVSKLCGVNIPTKPDAAMFPLSFGSGSFLSFGSGFGGSFSAGSGAVNWARFFARTGSGGAGGSGVSGSFGRGSGGFHEWEWEWAFRRFGSGGSFGLGGSFSLKSGSFGAAKLRYAGLLLSEDFLGSFNPAVCGSFRELSSDEYDMIMYATLSKCPLDRFGYGIHNI